MKLIFNDIFYRWAGLYSDSCCCCYNITVTVMSGMQYICSSDSTSVPQGVGRGLDTGCSVHGRTRLERVNTSPVIALTPHHTSHNTFIYRDRKRERDNIKCDQFFGYKIIRFLSTKSCGRKFWYFILTANSNAGMQNGLTIVWKIEY